MNSAALRLLLIRSYALYKWQPTVSFREGLRRSYTTPNEKIILYHSFSSLFFGLSRCLRNLTILLVFFLPMIRLALPGTIAKHSSLRTLGKLLAGERESAVNATHAGEAFFSLPQVSKIFGFED
jgi:hypothetical protein